MTEELIVKGVVAKNNIVIVLKNINDFTFNLNVDILNC